MRVVLDTSILISAWIAPAGKPAAIYNAWVEGKFTLLTCAAQSRRTTFHAAEAARRLPKKRISSA